MPDDGVPLDPAASSKAHYENARLSPVRQRQRLRLETQLSPESDYRAVSKLPTPVISQRDFSPFRAPASFHDNISPNHRPSDPTFNESVYASRKSSLENHSASQKWYRQDSDRSSRSLPEVPKAFGGVLGGSLDPNFGSNLNFSSGSSGDTNTNTDKNTDKNTNTNSNSNSNMHSIIPNIPISNLGRSGSLLVPKRSVRAEIQLKRSGSVGSPQRKPTTILHREQELVPVSEELPEEVYLATDTNNRQTAWEKIRVFGKGSFSEVIIAQPAREFLKPEVVNEVEDEVRKELDFLDSKTTEPSIYALNKLVAIKVTTLTKSDPKNLQNQMHLFNRDLEILANLPSHPCLVRMLGYSVDQEVHNRVFFVLPLCPGGDLFDMVSMNRSKMSVSLVRRIFADVCSATVFLHEHNIVHRDIKLENVLLALTKGTCLALGNNPVSESSGIDNVNIMQYKGPVAILTDLGLARRIDPNNPTLTTRCGSDDYVPPEIILGQPYDGRETDSWALGVLLYAMMEGRLPFDPPPNAGSEGRRQGMRTAHRIARVDWDWYKRKTPSEFDGGKPIVEKCLQRRGMRQLARDTYVIPWVRDARPSDVQDVQHSEQVFDLYLH